MNDITNKFHQCLPQLKVCNIPESQVDECFNSQTSDIMKMLQSILQLMSLQKQKYCSKTQLDSGSFTDLERDKLDVEINTSINLCTAKIKDLQVLLKNQQSYLIAKNTTEYAHKEIVISCLTSVMNKAILIFKEFKLYRQRQKERLMKLRNLSKSMDKAPEQRQQLQTKPQDHEQNTKDPLQQENQLLIKRYSEQVTDILSVQTQIKEINQTITKMAEIIANQELTTEEILMNASESVRHIQEANKNLITATKYNEQFGIRWAILFLSMSILLLCYDFITS